MFDFATAEYSAVGCFLIDSRCLPTIRERISTPEAFASEPCRKAFTAACKLADNGKPVDPVTVGREAGLDNAFLVDCMNTVPSCNGAEAYAQTVTGGLSEAASCGSWATSYRPILCHWGRTRPSSWQMHGRRWTACLKHREAMRQVRHLTAYGISWASGQR